MSIRNKAKAELFRLKGIEENDELVQRIERFKTRFSTWEIIYKIILREHQYYKKGVYPERMIINMNQVKNALPFAGYDYELDLLNNLFGSEKKVGERSVKVLRDVLTHRMPQSAIEELESRWDEVNQYMDQFINIIETYDNYNEGK